MEVELIRSLRSLLFKCEKQITSILLITIHTHYFPSSILHSSRPVTTVVRDASCSKIVDDVAVEGSAEPA